VKRSGSSPSYPELEAGDANAASALRVPLLWMLPLLIGCIGIVSAGWPLAMPRGVRFLLPLFFGVSVLSWVTALGLGRIPDRKFYPLVLLTGLPTALAPIAILTFFASRTWDPPRIFPEWWIFFLLGGVWVTLLLLRWPWGRLVGLSFLQTLLFVTAMEPGFGIHPAWAVFSGILLFTGWGISDRSLRLKGQGRLSRILLLWVSLSLVLVVLTIVSYSTVWRSIFVVRDFMGLHGPVLEDRPSGGLDTTGEWMEEDAPPASGSAGTFDSISDPALEATGPSSPGEQPTPGAQNSTNRSDSPSRIPALPRVSLVDPVLDQNDRSPVVTVFVRRTWENRVSSDIPRGDLRLWKTGTLDRFDGYAWDLGSTGGVLFRADNQGRIQLTDMGPDLDEHDLIGQEIILHSPEMGGLPYVGYPLAIASGIDLISLDESGALIPAEPVRARQKIRMFSVSPRVTPPMSEPPGASSLELPEIPARIHQLAAQLGAADASMHPYHYMDKILDYLGRNCRYTLEEPLPAGPDLLGSFLFDVQQGTCEHFASAFAVLARLGGIPARLAVGLSAPIDADVEVDPVTLTRADRHAWVEIWDADHGWIMVDPSNPYTLPVMENFSGLEEPESQTPWLLYAVLGFLTLGTLLLIVLVVRRLKRTWTRIRQEPIKIQVQVVPAPRSGPRRPSSLMTVFKPELRDEARLWRQHRRILELLKDWSRARGHSIRQPFWESLADPVVKQDPSAAKYMAAYERVWRSSLFSRGSESQANLEQVARELEQYLKKHAGGG
jgi:transglutaminase-like putative cysteine protease